MDHSRIETDSVDHSRTENHIHLFHPRPEARHQSPSKLQLQSFSNSYFPNKWKQGESNDSKDMHVTACSLAS